MPVLLLIIIGTAAGFIATRLMKMQTDIITTMAIGIFGALVGGLILRVLMILTGWMGGFVGAVLGAMLLIWLYRTYVEKR